MSIAGLVSYKGIHHSNTLTATGDKSIDGTGMGIHLYSSAKKRNPDRSCVGLRHLRRSLVASYSHRMQMPSVIHPQDPPVNLFIFDHSDAVELDASNREMKVSSNVILSRHLWLWSFSPTFFATNPAPFLYPKDRGRCLTL